MAPTGGARRSAAGHGAQARGNGWRPSGPVGLAGPSDRGARLGYGYGAAVLGQAGKGEGWAAVPGRAGKGERGQQAEIMKGKEKGFFSFLFLLFSKTLFKFNFQFFLKSLTNPKHSQNDMQQHVCIKKFLNLFLNFNSTKFIISLSFNAHTFA